MILESEISSIKTGWREIIELWIKKNPKKWYDLNANYETGIKSFKGHLEIFPSKEMIFRCFNYFEPNETKVVILGQDPYHGKGQAIGLCFGVHQDCKIPPSLRNINKELISDVGENIEEKRDLIHWAKQGVLMLNASLTVLEKCPSSHMKFWKDFTKYIIDYVSEHSEKVVFVAWGAFAHKKMEDIDLEKHELIVSSHPSPLSCNKKYKEFPPFKDSRPFSKINKLLDNNIEW